MTAKKLPSFCGITCYLRVGSVNAELEPKIKFDPISIAFSEVPMMGFEPIPRFSRERILSPLRLPFRHIGVALCILSFLFDGENGFRGRRGEC